MSEELIEAVKAALLPELAELKQGLADLKLGLADLKLGLAELRIDLKATNNRLDLLEERYDDLRDQMNQRFADLKADMDKRFASLENGQAELKRDIAEVRSYVWTTGLEQMAGRKKAPTKVREKDAGYGKKKG